MATFYQNKQTHTCSNCGLTGHTFRFCTEPVSSYGVLVFRFIGNSETWMSSSQPLAQVLMIQRKDSLGFMDIMRGKYKVNEPEYIRKQILGEGIYYSLFKIIVMNIITINIYYNYHKVIQDMCSY